MSNGNSMDIPKLFDKKENCCGCGACVNICPVHAIRMKEDENGFIYPKIEESLCVRCGSCKRVCAFQNTEETNNVLESYAAVARDREIRMGSASGGIFGALARMYVESGGLVYGACFNKDWSVSHIGVECLEDISRLQGSKYTQSNTGFTFQSVKKALSAGREVLCSGTPCQIAGLNGFLGRKYDNLLTVDLVCHGVPNNRMFQEYLEVLGKYYGGKVTEFSFRDKTVGWGKNGKACISSSRQNERINIWQSASSYLYYFSNGWISRDSCYQCPYACSRRPGDLTVGDYWGIEKQHPDYIGRKGWKESEGISLILVNTEQGKKRLQASEAYIEFRESTFEKVAQCNRQLRKPSDCGKRDEILSLYNEGGWRAVDERYRKNIGLRKYSSQIKAMIPLGIKRKLKKEYEEKML